jgi:hypothetical protein
MRKGSYQKLVEQVRALPADTVLAAASRCDGHTIVKPEAFLAAGLPQEIVEHVTRSHGSDGSAKRTIFVHGQPVKELSGVYGLDLLKFLASALAVPYERKLGRGSQAQAIQSALHKHFAPAEPRPPAT